jgi:hypothetical protein
MTITENPPFPAARSATSAVNIAKKVRKYGTKT